MELLVAAPSPFGRKVRAQIIECGLADDVVIIDAMTTPVDSLPSLAAKNPLAKIPCLVTDDGMALYDSRVITHYLETKSHAPSLYGETWDWNLLRLEALVDGMMDAGVLIVYEQRFRDEATWNAAWLAGQRDKIRRSLAFLEQDDAAQDLLKGSLNIVQIGLGCLLSYLDFRQPVDDWRTDHPRLAAWHADFEQRPSMQQTRPELPLSGEA